MRRTFTHPPSLGAVVAVAAAFPAAALTALVYRFPLPFVDDYARGAAGALPALLSMTFILFVGGAAVIAVLGACMGAVVARLGADDRKSPPHNSRFVDPG